MRQSFHGNGVSLFRHLFVVQTVNERGHIVCAAHLLLQLMRFHYGNDVRRVLFHQNKESLDSTLRILLDFGS